MKTKKIFIVLTIMIIALSNTMFCSYAHNKSPEIKIAPLYTHIQSIHCSLNISNSTANIICSALGNSSTNSMKISVNLQRKYGSSWKNVASFSDEGTRKAFVDKKYYLNKEGEYRIKCYVLANGIESDILYSYDSF